MSTLMTIVLVLVGAVSFSIVALCLIAVAKSILYTPVKCPNCYTMTGIEDDCGDLVCRNCGNRWNEPTGIKRIRGSLYVK